MKINLRVKAEIAKRFIRKLEKKCFKFFKILNQLQDFMMISNFTTSKRNSNSKKFIIKKLLSIDKGLRKMKKNSKNKNLKRKLTFY
jgi:hypothetical protein